MTDIKLIETGNGGDIELIGKDLSVIEGFGNMIYIALFGGNAQSTPVKRVATQQAFDCWMNNLLMPNNPSQQFNSFTETTLKTVALNSSGRLKIQEAVLKDLTFMAPFAQISVVVELPSIDRVKITIRVQEPDNLQSTEFIYIWDGTKQDLIGKGTSPNIPVIPPFVIPMQDETVAFMASVAARGVTLVEPYITRLNNTYYYKKQNFDYYKKDCWYNFKWIDTGYTEAQRKVIVLTDIKDPSKVATIHNDYVGSHVAGVGFVGNPPGSFGILLDYNPSLGVNYTQNDGIYSYLNLSNSAIASSWDISCQSTNYSVMTRPHFGDGEMICNEAVSIGNYTYKIPRAYNHQWRRSHRKSSVLTHELDNGVLVGINTAASGAITNQKVGLFGYYTGSWVGFYSEGIIGGVYFGGNGLNGDATEYVENTYMNVPIAGKPGSFENIIVSMGDSIFGPQSNGMFSKMYQRAIIQLGDNYGLTNLSVSGKWINDFDNDFTTKISGYYMGGYYRKYIAHVYASSNDLANGTSAASVFTKLKSYCNKLRGDGYTKIIISGVMDRQAALVGVSQAQFDAARIALNNLLLADFTLVNGTVPHLWNTNTVPYADFYLNIVADSNFANANDTSIFVDKVHLTEAGDNYYADTYMVPMAIII